MDYEKKYRDTVERAIAWRKKYVNSTISEDGTMIKDFDNIFPELKENEDERIRKGLIKAFGSIGKKEWGGINVKNAIAWLEKQSEQKSMKTCAEYYNKDSELKMPELSVFQNKLADILMQREYEGSTETEEDVASARLDYELAAIRISEELLPLAIMQKPAEWSEEDEENLKWFEKFFRAESVIAEGKDIPQDRYLWFKNLKGRVQPKQEWSEDTQQWIDVIIKDYEDLHDANKDHRATIQAKINILKSLRPQSQWRPSEEMLEALYRAIPENTMAISEDEMLLDKLYQGLKYGRVLSNK